MRIRIRHERIFRHWIIAPFVWANLFTILAADIIAELYHRIAFPLYGLPYVERKKYIHIDRHRLKYLSWDEKLGCIYCGYANGWIHYVGAIAANTEQYWCAIKHEKNEGYHVQQHQKNFADFGDEEAFKRQFS